MVSPSTTRRTILTSVLALPSLAMASSCQGDDKSNIALPESVTVPSNRQPEPKPFKAAKSISVVDSGAKTDASDNSEAFARALRQAGDQGEVIVPAGTFAITKPIDWPGYPVRVRGEGTAAQPSVLAFAANVVHGFGARGGRAGGSWLSNVTLSGTSSAQFFIQDTPGQQFVLDSCAFVDASTFAVQVNNAHVYLKDCRFLGKADGRMTALHGMGLGTKVTAIDCRITGCYRGLYCAGVDDLSARNVFSNAMWWSGNAASGANTLASATATSMIMRDAIALPAKATKFTVTAWKTLKSGGTLTPVGESDWYAIEGFSNVEPRLMVRTKDLWGTVLETKGSHVRIHSFYDWRTCHPVPAPRSTVSEVTVEQPFIAGIESAQGRSAKIVDRWKAGARSLADTPPAGARITIVPATDYQIFGTDGTKSMSAVGCVILNSWADSISTITSSNAFMSKNEIWDSQDVGITVQQGSGACRVEKNTMHRIGTAGVFIGTSASQVTENTITGAQHTAVREDSYGALQVEGAEKVAVWNNRVTCGGSPFEIRGLIIEGRYGPFPDTAPKKGPFSTDGLYVDNKFVGYPKQLPIPAPSTEPDLRAVEVTVRGKHASASGARWTKGTRIQALDGATAKAIGG